MAFTEQTKLGKIWANQEARDVVLKHLPEIAGSPYLSFWKRRTLPELAVSNQAWAWTQEHLENIFKELADVQEETEFFKDTAPPADYEDESVPVGSATFTAPQFAGKWDVFEITLQGPSHGNPFMDVQLSAEFTLGDRILHTSGFYDGEGLYRIRFMPDTEGTWTFRTKSTARSLNGIDGSFICQAAPAGNKGPVRVKNTFHFAYEDGTPYLPIGTTCYAWTHQGRELEEQTLETLQSTPFNKIRMCVFPKSYLYNLNEPVYYPYEGSPEKGWDYTRFNPEFFRHLEERVADLGRLGIEADLILFHPYDRWGFSEMKKPDDDRYLRYIAARLSAYRHVWWSLANEYDLMWSKETEDWERFAQIITDHDPYRHLISIHNCFAFYDYNRPWVTHCSIQRIDVYKTAENTDQWRNDWNKPVVIDECAYEGDIGMGWGNITGQEMVRRFWEGAVRGGYVGHGETYMHPDDILWWSKGGQLYGSSPQRIAFLTKIMENGPEGGLNPLKSEFDAPCAGIPDEYYLFYYGFNQPRYRQFNMKPGIRYRVDVIDTWEMTVTELDGAYEGAFRIELPGKQYMAVRLRKAGI
ncbi:DUF5605 domain-containing protein [Paenibacillus piri]|uniref:DUF5060 domain-containing protein n=1 Tax=Paenibacillus piri TaxID=2547395 RepID=A0A4R5KUS3_9BACL|nr:DUF5605 domain-containing protein [Paenibacillus piri]TDF98670.1 DUF5060 domain-containing protein [Paenibacillus piri]